MKKAAVDVESLSMSKCWFCKEEVQELFCVCGKLQPAKDEDYFSVLELSAAFDINSQELEKNYLQKQRKLHPDRFVLSEEQEKGYAARSSSLLNKAYRTLKDPVLRAEYLLKLKGREIPQTITDPELLMETLELQEEKQILSTVEEKQAFSKNIQQKIVTHLKSMEENFKKQVWEVAEREFLFVRYLDKIKSEVLEDL